MFKTAVILASGEGKRMNSQLPKHLKKLPNGQTIVGRVAESLANVCDRIICTIKSQEYIPLFEEAFLKISQPVELVVKTVPGEFTEILQVAELIHEGNIIQTNGDLITADGALEDFVRKYGDRDHFFRGREGNLANKRGRLDIFNSRISVVPARVFRNFSNVSKLLAAKELIISILLGRVVKVPTLFNIDTQEDYDRACEYFQNGDSHGQ